MREIITEYETEEVEKTQTVKEYETVEKEREVIISDLTGKEIDPDEHVELHANPKLEIELNRVDLGDMQTIIQAVKHSRGEMENINKNRLKKNLSKMSFLVSDATVDISKDEISNYDKGDQVTQPEIEESDEGMKWTDKMTAKAFFLVAFLSCIYSAIAMNDILMLVPAIAAGIALLHLEALKA